MTTTSDEGTRVIICGSMKAWNHMRDAQHALADYGIDGLIPDTDELAECASSEDWDELKKNASLRHFRHIQDEHTSAVLVVNVAKDGQRDYIGPNSFAEIAVAVAAGRSVYLLHGTPPAYSEELRAWGARELHGELGLLADEMRANRVSYAHAS